MRESLEQRMARVATETIKSLKSDRTGYRTACEGLPVLLLQCGLLAALAWLDASSQGWDKELGQHLRRHLSALTEAGPGQDWTERLSAASSAEYQVYFELAIRAAVWQKRLAKALIEKQESE